MQTDKIKVKIQELCPDVTERVRNNCDNDCYYDQNITLAVVLRAIRTTLKEHDAVQLWANAKSVELIVERGTYDGEGDESSFMSWNLEHDNYDQQSEECKQFIGSLLGV